MGEFPQIRGTFLGASMIWIMLVWGVYNGYGYFPSFYTPKPLTLSLKVGFGESVPDP